MVGPATDSGADLITEDTRVYEADLGITPEVAGATRLPVGKSFHFALTSVYLKDNRIPPRGFTNAAFQDVQAAPVGTTYSDGQYWDDTRFRLLPGAWTATVNVYYQMSSKEYVMFLRDENHTNDARSTPHEQWKLTGRSPPVLMATTTIVLAPFANGDANGDAAVNLTDFAAFLNRCSTAPNVEFDGPACRVFDFDDDRGVDLADFREFQLGFSG